MKILNKNIDGNILIHLIMAAILIIVGIVCLIITANSK